MNTLDIFGTFKSAWALYMANWRFYLGVMGAATVIIGFISMYSGFNINGNFDTGKWISAEAGGIVSLIAAIVGLIFQVALIRISLALVRGKEVEFEDLYTNIDVSEIIVYLVATTFAVIAIVLGTIALVIPGIYLAVSLLFVGFVAVDQGYGPVETLTVTRELMRGNWWKGLGFLLVSIGFNILGALALGIGLLWTIPVTSLAYAMAYNSLLDNTGEVAAIGKEEPVEEEAEEK